MQVSMRDFKSHLAEYILQARAGQTIELTSHRRVVARVEGVVAIDGTGASRLIAAGVAAWSGGKPAGATITLRAVGTPVSKIVLDDRG